MQMIINGEKRDAKSGRTIDTINPASGELIDTIPAAGPEDVGETIEHARTGAWEWGAVPAHQRSEILSRFVNLARTRTDELVPLLAGESGKVLAHAGSELETALRIFTGYAEEAKRIFGEAIPLDVQPGLEGDLLLTRREPLGVIAAVLGFNFPVELYAQKVGAALAGGNSVVVKPPEDDSLTCIRLTDLLIEAGVPGAAVQIVTGNGSEAGAPLSSSPDIDAVTFTGSTAVGTAITETAARNSVRAFLELSGNDAFIVCEDADVEQAVAEAVPGRLYGNGQVCVATKRLLVTAPVYDEFVRRLAESVGTPKLGDPTDPESEVGPLINQAAAEKVERQIADAVAQGGNIRLGGERQGAFIEPTILELDPSADIATDEEIFGPVWSVIKVADTEEAIRIANASSYGLGGAVFTRDMNRAFEVATRVETGMISINGGTLYRPDLSAFGGYKKSGNGREGFHYTLEEMTQIKNIVLRGVMPS